VAAESLQCRGARSPVRLGLRKAQQSLAKHRVSFEEASTVFYDEQACRSKALMRRAARRVSS
jgi:uncharacterized DUF497 family protein